jgi:hypothetical protein
MLKEKNRLRKLNLSKNQKGPITDEQWVLVRNFIAMVINLRVHVLKLKYKSNVTKIEDQTSWQTGLGRACHLFFLVTKAKLTHPGPMQCEKLWGYELPTDNCLPLFTHGGSENLHHGIISFHIRDPAIRKINRWWHYKHYTHLT